MSLILSGKGNQVLMVAPGKAMLLGPLPTSVATGGSITSLSTISGLAGWWDAGLATGLLGATGTPLTAFGAPAVAVADRSGASTSLAVWHAAASGTSPPMATPRLNGLLGGLGLNTIIPPACRHQASSCL